MARIAGVNIPDDKQVSVALTYIYGIGTSISKKILDHCKLDYEMQVKDLNETELNSMRDYISKNLTVEGDLKRIQTANVKRLKDINSYRGLRHKKNLPVRGQRTKTNARTKRGRRATVGGTKVKAATKT